MSKNTHKNLYSFMNDTYKYSCPYKDSVYHTINNGVNCICAQYKNNKKFNTPENIADNEKVFIHVKK